MIQINNVSKQFAGHELYKDLSLVVGRGERVGIVGRNGSGKSTLFKMILGQESIDEGSITIPKNYSIASLEQHINFKNATVLDECMSALDASERFESYRAEKILMGLGFREEDFKKHPSGFSGGFQIRINLAKALLKQPDMLLLDEPTNYLDIVSMRWLEKFLKQFPGEILIITHDRTFMDSTCSHVFGLRRKKGKKVKGNTHKFYQQAQEEDEHYEKTRMNVERKKQNLEKFITRFKAKASKATQAQSKMKQLEKLGTIDDLEAERILGFHFNSVEFVPKFMGEVGDVSFRWPGMESDLFSGLSFDIANRDRIAIVGKNGKGKSTLLKVLSGELEPATGFTKYHAKVKPACFGQTNVNRLHIDNTITQEIQGANADLSFTDVRGICGAMLFDGDKADKKISVLSGGERSRVLLGKILATPTNLLFLDEPTNHLDMESVDSLMSELDDYEGTVIMVTHNEEILRRFAKKIIVFQDEKAELFLGGYDDFLRRIGWTEEQEEKASKPKITRKEFKQQRSALIKERSSVLKPLRETVDKAEAEIMELEEKQALLNEELVAASESSNGTEVSRISKELGLVEKSIEKNFELLEVNSEKLNKLEEDFEKRLEELEDGQ